MGEGWERDARTVFAYSVSTKADERDLYEFFSQAGKVVDVKPITDRHTGRSKGMAYVEFETVQDLGHALALHGTPLCGHPVLVKPSEAEKNVAWEGGRTQPHRPMPMPVPLPPHGGPLARNLPPPPTPTHMHARPPPPPLHNTPHRAPNMGNCRLLVNQIPPEWEEQQLKDLFQPFGTIMHVGIDRDHLTGKSKGCGGVQFANIADAAKAIQNLNGREVDDTKIQVRMGGVLPVQFTPAQPGPAENLDLALEGTPNACTCEPRCLEGRSVMHVLKDACMVMHWLSLHEISDQRVDPT